MTSAFTSARALYDDYLREMQRTNALGAQGDLALEATERLEQVEWLFEKVSNIDRELRALEADITQRMRSAGVGPQDPAWSAWLTTAEAAEVRALGAREQALAFELKLHVEAFYYFADRLRRVLRSLPGLHRFQSPGVRDVRNHLLEHPEGAASGFTQQSWSWGFEEGVRLKPLRDPRRGGECVDRGFYINARELRDNLEARLTSVLGGGARPGG